MVNFNRPVQLHFIQEWAPNQLFSYQKPVYFIALQENFDRIPKQITKHFNVILTGKIGHRDCVVFTKSDQPMSKRNILVTAGLPYANGSIHLGHLVEYIQTDIWVRFQKMSGHQCFYICGSDSHGTPIMLKAQTKNIPPNNW